MPHVITNKEALTMLEELINRKVEPLNLHAASKKLSQETGMDEKFLYYLPYNYVAKSNPIAPALIKQKYIE